MAGHLLIPPSASPHNRDGRVTYDTGALVAAERNNRQMWALHSGYLTDEVISTVPAAVLTQVGEEVPGRPA